MNCIKRIFIYIFVKLLKALGYNMAGVADLRPDILHIPVVQGDTIDFDFNFFSDDAETEEIDITDWTPKVQIRYNGFLVLTATEGNGLTTEAPNILHVVIDNTSNILETQDYDYDLQFIDEDGKVSTWVKGQISIEAQQTT